MICNSMNCALHIKKIAIQIIEPCEKSWQSQLTTHHVKSLNCRRIMKENTLIQFSKNFAVDIINLCSNIKDTKRGNILINQLLRSGTSIGANIRFYK